MSDTSRDDGTPQTPTEAAHQGHAENALEPAVPRTRLAILKLTVPATIIRSACRGVARKAPAPKRSMS